jgi:hypothetical protein
VNAGIQAKKYWKTPCKISGAISWDTRAGDSVRIM